MFFQYATRHAVHAPSPVDRFRRHVMLLPLSSTGCRQPLMLFFIFIALARLRRVLRHDDIIAIRLRLRSPYTLHALHLLFTSLHALLTPLSPDIYAHAAAMPLARFAVITRRCVEARRYFLMVWRASPPRAMIPAQE